MSKAAPLPSDAASIRKLAARSMFDLFSSVSEGMMLVDLRGETSDLLLPEVAEAMRSRGPRAVVVTIPGCGHAPALNVPEQFALVERFLNGR